MLDYNCASKVGTFCPLSRFLLQLWQWRAIGSLMKGQEQWRWGNTEANFALLFTTPGGGFNWMKVWSFNIMMDKAFYYLTVNRGQLNYWKSYGSCDRDCRCLSILSSLLCNKSGFSTMHIALYLKRYLIQPSGQYTVNRSVVKSPEAFLSFSFILLLRMSIC